jgi:hypothetical protein
MGTLQRDIDLMSPDYHSSNKVTVTSEVAQQNNKYNRPTVTRAPMRKTLVELDLAHSDNGLAEQKHYANGERENAIDITREECRRFPIIHRILGGGGYSRSRPHRRITTTDRKSSSGAGSQQRNRPLRGGKGKKTMALQSSNSGERFR